MDESDQVTSVKVLFFAKARELSGVKEDRMIIPRKISKSQLIEEIVLRFNLEAIRESFILAVNEEFLSGSDTLELFEDDEIAVIPPLSGGKQLKVIICCEMMEKKTTPIKNSLQVKMEEKKSIVYLQKDKLNINNIIDSVVSPSCGAISTFIGTTRDNFESKKVLKLEYQAYEPMALKEMTNICNKIREQWNVQHIAISHRLGEVPVCESSIAIAISSPHRQDSLHALQFAIDTVKSSVPIWKKEVYEADEAVWKENKECDKNIVIKSEPLDVEGEAENFGDNERNHRDNRIKINMDSSQIQVKASAEEINKRIRACISRNRDQSNIFNIQEFCSHRNLKNEHESSCARVDAILIPRKDSKSHVKVHRVFNAHGPQTMNTSARQISSELPNTYGNLNHAIDERLSSPEKFLGIDKPVPKDIYQRIKNIEDRIIFLEGLSPEYEGFFTYGTAGGRERPQKPVKKRTFSSAELDDKLFELQEKYAKKVR